MNASSTQTLLIQGGHVIDPGRINGIADVLIEQGKIAAVGANLTAQGKGKNGSVQIIDARHKLVLPGFVDLHVHFREPGFEYKETIKSGNGGSGRGRLYLRLLYAQHPAGERFAGYYGIHP